MCLNLCVSQVKTPCCKQKRKHRPPSCSTESRRYGTEIKVNIHSAHAYVHILVLKLKFIFLCLCCRCRTVNHAGITRLTLSLCRDWQHTASRVPVISLVNNLDTLQRIVWVSSHAATHKSPLAGYLRAVRSKLLSSASLSRLQRSVHYSREVRKKARETARESAILSIYHC